MSEAAEEAIQRILGEMRRQFGMDVAFVSELGEDERVFRYVDTELAISPVRVGGSDPSEESYCRYVVAGEIPELLRDPSQHPVTAQLAVTHELPVGTHLSVPIVLSDGSVYGTFCCFAHRVVDSVAEEHVAALRVIADILGEYLETLEVDRRERDRQRRRVAELVVGRDVMVVCQPIERLEDGELLGMEALARFPTLGEEPAGMFAQAWAVGVGLELELLAVEAALGELERLPAEAYLSVNVAPTTLASDRFAELVAASRPERLVVEVTEHAAVEDYEALAAAVGRLSELGVRLAIDDVGTGFSGLSHIVRLSPDIIKVDGSLVRGVGESNAKQAMLAALVTFAARMGTEVIAEGVESEHELTALRVLGVGCGQGFHLARPRHLGAAVGRPEGSDAGAARE